MAAAATSFLCDDYATAPAAAPRFTRWFEGLAIAAVLAGTAYFVWRALPHTVIQPDRIPRLEVFLPVAVLIGVIIRGQRADLVSRHFGPAPGKSDRRSLC
jgi:hypothetical protein